MKKILLIILLSGIMIIGVAGCGNSKKVIKDSPLNDLEDYEPLSTELFGDEPLSDNSNLLLFVRNGSKSSCINVELAVYSDGRYQLFTAYEGCKSSVCNTILKYTRSLKGTTDYDISKIMKDDSIVVNKPHTMDNLPEYEIFLYNNDFSLEAENYTIEKGTTNKYLEEFLKEINVDLKTCAQPDYSDD